MKGYHYELVRLFARKLEKKLFKKSFQDHVTSVEDKDKDDEDKKDNSEDEDEGSKSRKEAKIKK